MSRQRDFAGALWQNRRRYAAVELVKSLRDIDDDPATLLPTLTAAPNPFGNHYPMIIQRHDGAPFDVRVQLDILVPPGEGLPAAGAAVADQWIAGRREATVLRAMSESPIAAWLTRVAPTWNMAPGQWEVTDATDGRIATKVAISSASTTQTEGPPDQGSPVTIAALVRPGGASRVVPGEVDVRALLLTIEIGVWLSRIDLPEPSVDAVTAHGESLTKFSLEGFVHLLNALLMSARSAFVLYDEMTGRASQATESVVRLTLQTAGEIGSVIDLPERGRVAGARQAQFDSAAPMELGAFDAAGGYGMVADFVVGSVNAWLTQAGYRHYEQILLDLWYDLRNET
jgi:hypothetical protein